MRIRRIQLEQDYPTLRTWWERRGSAAPQMGVLPPVGVIAEEGGKPMACAWLYECKGDTVGMVEWEATNPDCHSAFTAVRALNMVFDFFEAYCAAHGIGAIFSWVSENRGDGRILEARKWVKCPGERHALMAFSPKLKEALCPQ